MKYLVLCQVQPAAFVDIPAAAEAERMQAMQNYHQQMIQAGVLLAAGWLAPPDTAQRVVANNGRIETHGGPALVGDVQIGGYYLLDVASEAEATAWTAKCPLAHAGALEVRQVVYSAV